MSFLLLCLVLGKQQQRIKNRWHILFCARERIQISWQCDSEIAPHTDRGQHTISAHRDGLFICCCAYYQLPAIQFTFPLPGACRYCRWWGSASAVYNAFRDECIIWQFCFNSHHESEHISTHHGNTSLHCTSRLVISPLCLCIIHPSRLTFHTPYSNLRCSISAKFHE